MTSVAPPPKLQGTTDNALARLAAVALSLGEERQLADLCNRFSDLLEWKVPVCSKTLSLRDILPFLMERGAALIMVESEIELDMDRLLTGRGMMSEFKRGRAVLIPYVSIAGDIEPGDTFPDLIHLTLKLAIYCDGHDAHSSVKQRERDYRVGNALQARGYTILRFSGHQIQRQPEYVAGVVQQSMRRLKGARDAQ